MHYKTTLHRQIADLTRWGDCKPNSLDVAVANTRQHLSEMKQPERLAYHHIGIRMWPDMNEKITLICGMSVGNVLYQILEEEVPPERLDVLISNMIRANTPSSIILRGEALRHVDEGVKIIEKILTARDAEIKEMENALQPA